MKTAIEQWNIELERRLSFINSEPDGVVRETMIQNMLIGFDNYLETEKQQIIAANQENKQTK